ncbi:MAG: NAD(P)H-dependent oxidoreductase subunit E [Victivallaceae bacterium]|nr:NAD(P)H-dependent oxidoreductase subunit E [Victivallaceae bacterium]
MSCQCGNATPADRAKFEELGKYISSLPIAENPSRSRGFLIQTLHRAQSMFGYLPEEVQKFVAAELKISPADVYGVISFYSFFTDKPLGRHKINVCTGTACFVKGAGKVLEEFKRRLGVSEGETTADGRFFLGALRCVGACSLAPVVMVDDRVYGNMTAEKVADVLAQIAD